MLITMLGLPPKTTFQAVKTLLKQECNIIDFILDNLVNDGPNAKKVRIGVSDDAEGYRIIKCLNGFRMSPNHLLKIERVGKPLNPPPQHNYDQKSNFQNQLQNDYPNQSHPRPSYQNSPVDTYSKDNINDTRKGNYVPPHMRKKNLPHHVADAHNAGPSMASEMRSHNLEQMHRSHIPQSSGPHDAGSHNPGPQVQDSRHTMSSEQGDMMTSPQWLPDWNLSRNEWVPPGPGNVQGQNRYNQKPNQGGFGQQPPGQQDPYTQGRGLPGQDFGFQPKPTIQDNVEPPVQRETRQHVLRTVDIVDTQPQPRQYLQVKPITIMKDNFQGPSQYGGVTSQLGNYPAQGPQHVPVWEMNQQSKSQYDGHSHPTFDKRLDAPKQEYEKRGHFIPIGSSRPHSPSRQEPNRRLSPNQPLLERRASPNRPGHPVRDFSPSGRRISPRRFSPRRKISPGRRMSPSDRRMSPGRRYSPGRKMSPGRFTPERKGSPGRSYATGVKMSPGRRLSPGRKMSPGRRLSPGIKMSPGRRLSPGRKMSPGRRYSPGRKMSPGRRDDGRRMSPNDRRMGRRYSPGRPSSPTRRLVSPSRPRFSPSRLGDKPADKFLDEGKVPKPIRPAYELSQGQNQSYTGGYRDTPQYSTRQEPHLSPWQTEKIIFPSKAKEDDRRDMSRRLDKPADKSPSRMSRSPIKDRFRRHSPSPRSSRSPRRSWALEKRSPNLIREPPPPPAWPGQNADSIGHKLSRFNPKPPKIQHTSGWERLDESRSFQAKVHVRTDLKDKYAPQREEFDDKIDYRNNADRKQMERDREFRRSADRNEFRRESPRRDDRTVAKKVFSDIDKDFQEIYKRAVEFRKKTEERQKSGDSRRDEYDNHHKSDGRYRPEDTPRRSRSRERGEWNVKDRKRIFLSPTIKLKRDKAIDEISNRIINKYDLEGDQKFRVTEELKVTLSNIFLDMFSEKDVSFIELVIKYQAKYPPNEEEKLIKDVMARLPSHYRNLKRKATGGDASEIAAKSSRRSPPRSAKEEPKRPKLSESVIPEWTTGLAPPKVLNMSLSVAPAINMAAPGTITPPVYLSTHVDMLNLYNEQQLQYGNSAMQQSNFCGDQLQQQFTDIQQQFFENQQMYSNQLYNHDLQKNNEGYNLYLCQDDFESFSSVQAEYLKNFIFDQIVKVTETTNGWAPDITLKGLQSPYRYELSTMDVLSKDWIINLNFTEFEYFNVLVYTKEELWYERAAIWLPGHSRNRTVEPLDKLKMQNKYLDGINLGKWKFVKKIVTLKGTRLYVDMPPSSARALEKHKMLLSYELQKVNVFLKAVAIDKDVFDSGLKEVSITDPTSLTSAVLNSPMPTLNTNSEPGLVKIGINGKKTLSVEEARKIKDVIVYHLVKYLQQNGASKIDFVKFGFCSPNFLGVVPENSESKKWIMSRDFGKMNRSAIIVFGDDNDNTKYFKMFAVIPHEYHSSMMLAFERLKQSNQGIKGIHFNLWKPINITTERKRATLEVEIDLDSVEAISRMKYKLDYVGEFGIQVVNFHSEYSFSKLEDKIKKCKLEQMDSYDVANMDLDSDSNDDDVVCVT